MKRSEYFTKIKMKQLSNCEKFEIIPNSVIKRKHQKMIFIVSSEISNVVEDTLRKVHRATENTSYWPCFS